ncbi:hypothetical protein cyc_05775 [Cyclospora cayetanensis]|uniref:Transmembrane protein n=1 Tax=Cyclospora cayetanensis TaxID=88456 RepID=A0A1D3D653_9EIME|nr:hypothetical protein cyc_05775 [Cyclospora cayetanensis]
MHLGSQIFGAQFGAHSFKSYIPIIAAILVAAVVGEIAHNAKTRRHQREHVQRLSRMRQLVRRQRRRRDLALLEAEKRERRAMRKLPPKNRKHRHLYEPEGRETGHAPDEVDLPPETTQFMHHTKPQRYQTHEAPNLEKSKSVRCNEQMEQKGRISTRFMSATPATGEEDKKAEGR